MVNSDTIGKLRHDVASALGLLTRLPLPMLSSPSGASAAWAWPVAGATVGALAGIAGMLAFWIGLNAALCAALVLAVQAVVTGAMHEDGLADTADGFWGGWTRERRLEIMKDSHIGTYGVLALILVTLARWAALTALFGAGAEFWLLVATGALSRAPMAFVQFAMPNARGSGLSKAVGRPSRDTALAGAGLGCLFALPGLGMALIPALIVLAGATLTIALISRAKIGGQTGDVLGATQIAAELSILSVAVALF